ncbi:hypothetical protein D3C87_1979100 [compost metagenome]
MKVVAVLSERFNIYSVKQTELNVLIVEGLKIRDRLNTAALNEVNDIENFRVDSKSSNFLAQSIF